MNSEKQTDGTVGQRARDRNNYSLEGEKRPERHLCLLLQNVENEHLHEIKPAPDGSH